MHYVSSRQRQRKSPKKKSRKTVKNPMVGRQICGNSTNQIYLAIAAVAIGTIIGLKNALSILVLPKII
jgi:hypothetical protein